MINESIITILQWVVVGFSLSLLTGMFSWCLSMMIRTLIRVIEG
jgi:hypothetical protein